LEKIQKLNKSLKEKFSGRFVVLDGPDGCGKSTQTQLLVEWLQKQDVQTASFRGPGDTYIGENRRNFSCSSIYNFKINIITGNNRWINLLLLKD
jgi:energy-coupling factor transporter ATP-binding protein EcfA2